jgi:3-hydroxyacyl-[acyl-carrier-protein] dehydratase
VTTHKWGDDECTFKAQGTIDGESAVSARITLSQLNLRDKSESQAKIDDYLTTKMKELYAQVWRPPVE